MTVRRVWNKRGVLGAAVFQALAAALIVTGQPASAAVPSEQLVPPDALFWVSSVDPVGAKGRWDQTQIGKLSNDPAMQPFLTNLRDQLEKRWVANRQQINFDWNGLFNAVDGEAAVFFSPDLTGGLAATALVNVGGNTVQAQAVLTKLDASLAKIQAKRSVQNAAGVQLVVHEIPPAPNAAGKAAPKGRTAVKPLARRLVYFLHNGLLGVSGDLATASSVVGRLAQPGKQPSLQGHAAFQAAFARLEKEKQAAPPDLRWYVRPMALALGARAEAKLRGEFRAKDTDVLAILENQGFEAVQAVAGHHFLRYDKFDVFFRIAVHVPGKLDKALRVLALVNSPNNDPQPWVSHEVSGFARVHMDVKEVFEGLGNLVDEVMEEPGFFDDLIRGTAEEKDGPMVDLRKDIAQKLSNDVTVFSDTTLPVTSDSQRVMVAIETPDADGLAKNIEKAVKDDPAFKKREFNGKTIYEYQEEPQRKTPPSRPGKRAAPAPVAPKSPPGGVAVVDGKLMVSSHIGLLERTIGENNRRALNADPAFKLVSKSLNEMADGPTAIMTFSRQAEEFQAPYELLKAGKLKDDQSPLGRILRRIVGEDAGGNVQVNGALLPAYQLVRRYLAPAGWFGRREDAGLFIQGFSLKLDE